MGPFEEEEEGTGVASDVVKVEGEDPTTRSPALRNDPGTVTIPQYWFNNKTKQHTHVTIPQYWFNKTKQHTHCSVPNKMI